MKFMITELSDKTGYHRNTIYRLIRKGIIKPVETISHIMIFNDETADSIMKHYENRKLSRKELRELEMIL